ncbi:DNA-directed RNA polymerase, subunit M [Methanothermus fervidus DSM 2088]|uniref:Transcription factor S n=1 Tax=Methanothermus fervidus (strain ATCC 43054 / DSM 2088 / JCM 10308 / V24 S) TaxID=523846 RepID=E3GW48_METFV|nr:transcription factor S [Methanothermus fervidus]ADP77813.1 DNA-directed RNA polymerase, subunit M [Methanothermus fervidus DSM 2088]
MEFCPKCKALMVSKNGVLKCTRCGYEKKLDKNVINTYKTTEKVGKREAVIFTKSEVKTMPTVKKECPKCGNNEAYWWLQQTRRADESETRFFRCTKCKYTWREYD